MRWSSLLAAAALMALGSLPGAAQQAPEAAARAVPAPPAAGAYRLQKNDFLAISVTPEREFSRYNRQTKVRIDGRVLLYKIGTFTAATRTLEELGAEIEAQIPPDEKTQAKAEVTVKLLSPSYELRKGDQVAISVSSHKEYDAEAVVLPDGSVLLRNVSATPALEKTLPALALDIRYDLISGEDLVNPKVSVTLVRAAPEEAPKPPARRFITISGAVATPGPVEYEDGLTIRRALVLAGGLLREANHQDIRVYPKAPVKPAVAAAENAVGAKAAAGGKQEPPAAEKSPLDPKARGKFEEVGGFYRVVFPADEVMLSSAPEPLAVGSTPEAPRAIDPQNTELVLADGDAIEVRLRPVINQSMVRLSGLVRTPGLVPLTPKMRLEDLFKEGGLSPLADPKRIQVYRNGKKLEREPLDLQAEVQAEPPKKFLLEANDEIYVPRIGDSVIVIGGVQTPGWRPLKMVEKTVDGKKVIQGQTIREFFLQNDTEVTAGNQDLPTTYNPNLADLKAVEVIRDGKVAQKVNLIEVTRKEGRTDNIALKPGDVIYLPPKGRPNRGPLTYLREVPYLGFLFGLF